MRYSSRKLSHEKVITTACNFWRQIACSFQVKSGNVLLLGKKSFEIPPFFQTWPGDLGKKVHACSLHFSALKACTGIIALRAEISFYLSAPSARRCARSVRFPVTSEPLPVWLFLYSKSCEDVVVLLIRDNSLSLQWRFMNGPKLTWL